MADTPTPRSLQQIEGDMFDAFIAKTGISSLKVGSPLRSLIEAVAQSQLQNSADIFQLLNSSSLDRATGTALEAIAADEGIVRQSASASFGYVTFTDLGFTKVETLLLQPASVSDKQITVKNSTSIVAGSSIKLNDGESNQETVVVSSVGQSGVIMLQSPLRYSHAVSAPVLKLQFGDRLIPAGTSIGGTVKFNTINQAIIPSGETTIENVPVLAATLGTAGNVGANSVSGINSSLPFTGSVTNPLPFANAIDAETDDQLRQRIRIARQTRQRGTPLAIQNAVNGVTSADENKRVASAKIVDVGEGKAVLYIDDGTGYEGKVSSIGLEVLVAFASGGEQYFELQGGRPVVKAFVESGDTSPFNVRGGDTLTVKVGNVTKTHTFSASDFAVAGKANVYEIVSSINADVDLNFVAMTSSDKQKFMVAIKDEADSFIQVTGGGERFGFSTTPSRTLYLFLDGELLEQGTDYTIDRNRGQIFLKEALKVGQNLVVGSVDTRAVLVSGPLPETHTSTDSLESLFFVTDDSTTPSRTLYLFLDGELLEQGTDYTIDRNRGQIFLKEALKVGQNLVVGSVDTRAVLVSGPLPETHTSTDSLESLFFVTDDSTASIVSTNIQVNETVQVIQESGQTSLLGIVFLRPRLVEVKAGDWMVAHDTSFSTVYIGKVVNKISNYKVTIDTSSSSLQSGFTTLSEGGITFVRTSSVPQRVSINSYASGPSTSGLDILVADLNSQFVGMHARLISQNRISFSSNSYSTSGSVMFVAKRSDIDVGIEKGAKATNLPDYNQSVASGLENAVPSFVHSKANTAATNVGSIVEFTVTEKASYAASGLSEQAGFTTTYANGNASSQYAETLNGSYSTTDYRIEAPGYHISSSDVLNVVVDGSPSTQSYAVPMVYEGKVSIVGSGTYFVGADGETQTIKDAFNSADLTDYAIWTAADTASPVTDTRSNSGVSVVFKETNFGPSNLLKKIDFKYPSAANNPFLGTVNDSGILSVALASDTETRTLTSTDGFIYFYNDQSTLTAYLTGWIDGFLSSDGTTATLAINYTNCPLNVLEKIPSDKRMIFRDRVTNQSFAPFGGSYLPNATFDIGGTARGFSFPAPSTTALPLTSVFVCFSVSGTPIDFSDVESSTSPMPTICVLSSSLKDTDNAFTVLPKGQYRVQASSEQVIQLRCLTSSIEDTFIDLSESSDLMSFIDLKDEVLSDGTFTNPYVTIQTPASSAIIRSTADHYLFNSGNIANDGKFSSVSSAAFIQSCDTGTYQFTTKTTNSLSDGETVQLVPVTARNVKDKISAYFKNLNVEATLVSHGDKLVEVSRTVNPDGSLQIVGGSANSHEVLTYGLNDSSDSFKVQVSDLSGFAVGNMVKVESFDKKRIQKAISASLDISTSDSLSTVTVVGGSPSFHGFFDLWGSGFTPVSAFIPESKKWAVKRTGNLLSFTSFGSLSTNDIFGVFVQALDVGSKVVIHRPKYASSSYTPVSGNQKIVIDDFSAAFSDIEAGDILVCQQVSTGNEVEKTVISVESDGLVVADISGIENGCYIYPKNDPTSLYGTFTVLGTQYDSSTKDVTFWIETPATFVEGMFTLATKFLSKESAVVGDTLTLSVGGSTANVQVQELNIGFTELTSGTYISATRKVKTTAVGVVDDVYLTSGWIRTANSNEVGYAQLESATIGLNNMVNMKLKGWYSADYAWFNATENSPATITALNKLNFDTAEITSIRPGYNYYSGLIGESNKVVYGDMQDPVNYSGYAAANASIEVLPPRIKRIYVSLVIRMSGGFSTPDTLNAVRSAVSTAVLSTPVGTSVSFSDIIELVNQVPGVFAVSVSQPPFAAPSNLNGTTDIIPVSAGEKAMIVYPEQDIQVKILGA